MKFPFFVLSVAFLLLSACSFDSPAKRLKTIAQKELALNSPDEKTTPEQLSQTADDLLNLYLSFVEVYPADAEAPEVLYKAAMIQAEKKQQFEACISTLERLRREYPDHRRAENALFLIGYTYSEQLQNFEQAKVYYTAFLDKYPTSELASSVQFELQNLGKPVEELDIIKNLTAPAADK